MSYNLDSLTQQLQNIQQQYQQLANLQSQPQLIPNQPIQQTMPQVQPPVQSRQIQYVEGMAGARLYQNNLPNNSSEIIMDKNEDLFYKVSKDANGTPTKKIPVARFTVIEPQPEEEEPVFLTRKDFDEFKEEMRQLLIASKKEVPKGGIEK